MTVRLPALLAALAALVIAGCGGGGGGSSPAASTSTPKPAPTSGKEVSPSGDIPDNQAYVAFQPPGAPFSVKVPEGWSQTSRGKSVQFTDKLNTIELQWAAAAPPAPANAKATTVSRKAGKATRATYLVQGQPDPVTGKTRTNAVERYVFPHNGKQAILTLTGPKGADNVDPWRIVTDSLRWTA
jgi:hypothetical protein